MSLKASYPHLPSLSGFVPAPLPNGSPLSSLRDRKEGGFDGLGEGCVDGSDEGCIDGSSVHRIEAFGALLPFEDGALLPLEGALLALGDCGG